MGKEEIGPDYGVFNFVELFQKALGVKTADAKNKFYARFEHKVSDHMPLWMRQRRLLLLVVLQAKMDCLYTLSIKNRESFMVFG